MSQHIRFSRFSRLQLTPFKVALIVSTYLLFHVVLFAELTTFGGPERDNVQPRLANDSGFVIRDTRPGQ